jgi:hypothetical protein
MKLFLPIFLLGIAMSGPAAASSFVMLQRAAKPISPSIIYFGEPEAAAAAPEPQVPFDPPAELAGPPGSSPTAGGSSITVVSPSVIALGTRHNEVEFGAVAAVGENERPKPRNPHLPPMVIRGGIYGDAFTAGDGGAAAALEQAPAAQQQAAGRPAAGGSDDAPRQKPGQPSSPEPPPVAVRPLPTAKME